MELVRRVTGHQTVDVVLKHYFRPGREDFQKALASKMPALLTAGAAPAKPTQQEEAIEVLRDVTPKTWRKAIDRALALLTGQAA